MTIRIKLPDMYASELIPCMLFDCEEDANEFDRILNDYVNNPDAMAEYDKAECQYASVGAVMYNINNGTFHFGLQGEFSEELIGAAENMVDTYGVEIPGDDPYTPLMQYLFSKLHPNVTWE